MNNFPTHRHKSTGNIVFPDGFRANQIEPLPDDYWPARCEDESRAAAINTIREEASARILEVASIERQINDLANPDELGAKERRAAIDAIRAESNTAQDAVKKLGEVHPMPGK